MHNPQNLVDYGLDLVSLLIVVAGLYHRRHGRTAQQTVYVAVNVGLVVTLSLLHVVQIDFRVGFGLFALLRLVHLRARKSSEEESAYWFAVLVLALVNGVVLTDWWLALVLNVLVIATLALVDTDRLRYRARNCEVVLDEILHDQSLLVAELERRLNGRVVHHIVEQVDYVRESMVVDVRYRPGHPAAAVPVGGPGADHPTGGGRPT
jgi:hypothetical protein